jgi:uncharacterized protein YjiS (DUF1127 family)
MTPRQQIEQTGLFHASTSDRQSMQIDAIRMAAMRARDEAIAAGMRKLFGGIGRALAAVATAVVTWPDRRRTYENLRGLTDRELADIGLTRGEISRVFEPEFRMNTRNAANSNAAPAGNTRAA